MNKITLIFAAMVLGLSTGFTGNTASTSISLSHELDKQVSLIGRYSNNLVYFKLLMLNESKSGVYSMVKKFDDGTTESVGIRNFYANSVNIPLMYSFLDKDLSEVDVTYVLYRISTESEVVQAWAFSASEKTLCEIPLEENFQAMNSQLIEFK